MISIALEDLLQLRHYAKKVKWNSPRAVSSSLRGRVSSRVGSRGVDFKEVREYQHGDEIRYLDWRATARSGKPHTKIFCEDREYPVFFLVDLSPTMFFGTRVTFKSVVAAKMAALISWVAIENQNTVGGIVFSGSHQKEIKQMTGLRGGLTLCKAMCDMQPTTSEHSFLEVIARCQKAAKKGSRIVILSDFYHLDLAMIKSISELTASYQVMLGLVFDPLEKAPPPPDHYAVTNGTQITYFDSSQLKFCETYAEKFNAREQQLKSLSQRYGARFLSISTESDVSTLLS